MLDRGSMVEVRARTDDGVIEWSVSGYDRAAVMRDARIYAHHYPELTVETRELPYLGRWSKWRKVEGYA